MEADNTFIMKFGKYTEINELYKPKVVSKHSPDWISFKYTGLPMIVWIYPVGVEGHSPVLRVQNNYDKIPSFDKAFIVSISDSPHILIGDKNSISYTDLEKVFKWIAVNKRLLTFMWKCMIDDSIFFKKMKKYTDDIRP
jgi:hypothetical protein